MSDYPYELVGGDPALDFLNTVHDWGAAQPRDYLAAFADVIRFGVATAVLTAAEARKMEAQSTSELRRLRDLRARLERIFRAVVTGGAPVQEDLEQLARDAAHAAGAARYRGARGRVSRTIGVDEAGVAIVRWRIVEAAATLLTSTQLERVKACPSCGWFFLDVSKNRSRRWCSMATCGSVAKARAYYQRTRRSR